MSSCSRARKVLMNHALHASACQPRNSAHICHLSDNHLNQIWVSQGVTSPDCSVMRRVDTRPPSATAGDAHSCLNAEMRWSWKAWWQFMCSYLHSIVIERSGVRISNQLNTTYTQRDILWFSTFTQADCCIVPEYTRKPPPVFQAIIHS